MHSTLISLLLALQCFHVLFLSLHDWIPFGSLNDLQAVRKENPVHKLLAGTLISAVPFCLGFAASIFYFGRPYPPWLLWYLWISYALLFLGELQAWWIPYFLRAEPERAKRYDAMFAGTHAFLPARNGIRINTLHILLHSATLATLLTLLAISLTGS